MTKEQTPDYLKIAVDSMVDNEVEGPRVILGPTALKNLVNRVRNAALNELSDKLKKTGATLPVKQEHEGGNAVLNGVSIALVVIEEMKEPTP